MNIGAIWDLIILNPAVNILIALSRYLFDSFGLTIIVLTIVVNLVMFPLTRKQLKSTKAMQDMQGKVAELKKKYGNDKQKAAQEQMRLFKEAGVNPAGCLLPMVVQMPVWIVLYQSIIRVMAAAPEEFLNLAGRLYPTWNIVFEQLPLGYKFLWFNLATPDMLLALLVGASMWVQQKMSTVASADPQQKAQSDMMLWMMPIMFGMLSIQFPSGLALYWVTSTSIRVLMQYFISGWGGLTLPKFGKTDRKKEARARIEKLAQKKTLTADKTSADIVIKPSAAENEVTEDGKSGDKRQNSGRSGQKGSGTAKRQPGRGGDNRRKGR